MERNYIKNLLDKFYAGNTSLEEEKTLSDFFRKESIPEELIPDKELFNQLVGTPINIPDESLESVKSLINSLDKQQPVTSKSETVNIKRWLMGIAASLALIIGIGLFQKQQAISESLTVDTYQNPDDAYRATMDVLKLFSHHFSEGMETVEKADYHLKKAKNIVDKSINK